MKCNARKKAYPFFRKILSSNLSISTTKKTMFEAFKMVLSHQILKITTILLLAFCTYLILKGINPETILNFSKSCLNISMLITKDSRAEILNLENTIKNLEGTISTLTQANIPENTSSTAIISMDTTIKIIAGIAGMTLTFILVTYFAGYTLTDVYNSLDPSQFFNRSLTVDGENTKKILDAIKEVKTDGSTAVIELGGIKETLENMNKKLTALSLPAGEIPELPTIDPKVAQELSAGFFSQYPTVAFQDKK